MRLDGCAQEIVSSRWWRPIIIGAPIVTRLIETDYLVVGAGAMGMAFTDALIANADVHVTLVEPDLGPCQPASEAGDQSGEPEPRRLDTTIAP
jgi:hypothetical protein